MGKRKCVRSCKKFSWVDVTMGKTGPCFFAMPRCHSIQVRRFLLSGDFTLQENLDDLSS